MKLTDINEQTIDEWSLKRSDEWKRGFAMGKSGRPLDVRNNQTQNEEFRRGWIAGYKKFMAKMRPDLMQKSVL